MFCIFPFRYFLILCVFGGNDGQHLGKEIILFLKVKALTVYKAIWIDIGLEYYFLSLYYKTMIFALITGPNQYKMF